jgi:hypothetical protein
VPDSCEHGNKTSGSIKDGQFLNYLSVLLYGIPDDMRGDVNKVEKGEVLLLLPNLVPHPVSVHITGLVLFK